MEKLISRVLSILGLIGICFSAFFFVDMRHAHAPDVDALATRLEYKVTSDRYEDLEQRAFELDGMLSRDPENTFVAEELQKALSKKERLSKKLEDIEKKVGVSIDD